MWAKTNKTGFTIVELLIVIVVIAILAAITIVAYNGIQNRAKVNRATTELRSLEKAILVARNNQGKNLYDITGSNCTRCSDQARYELTLDRISTASGINLNGLKAGDPWGEKYSIDENEGEGANPCANRDSIALLTSGRGVSTVVIPFYACP